MNEDQRKILQFCIGGWRSLAPLKGEIPRATLYRVARSLCGRKLLVHRRKRGYRTTKRGIQALQEGEARMGPVQQRKPPENAKKERKEQKVTRRPPVNLPAIQKFLSLPDEKINCFLSLYPPLRKVPTSTHRAMIELVMAEICDRSWPEIEDHHLNFLNFGSIFTWKSNLGKFCACMVAGEDAPFSVVEMASESGSSLWLRKTGTGKVIFERRILRSPFVCLDDYHKAKREVKEATTPLLAGRIKVPVENEMQDIRCTVLVNRNPQKGATSIFGKTEFDARDIRRFVPCNLDTIELPDLKRVGEEALGATRSVGPLEMRKPTLSCRQCRKELINYFEKLFTKEGQQYIDVDGLLNIARGLTGYGFAPSEAIRWVLYKISLPYHTVGWLNPKWVRGSQKGKPLATAQKPSSPKLGISRTTTDSVEQLRFLTKKREQKKQIEELIRKTNVDSPACSKLQGDLTDLKRAIERATSQKELDELIEYRKKNIEPPVQEALEEYKKLELERLAQDKKEELEKLTRCAEFLDEPFSLDLFGNLEDNLEELGCEKNYYGSPSWGEAKKAVWERLQQARGFLQKVLPILPPEKANKLKKVLNPVKILNHNWLIYYPPRSVHIMTVFNSVECCFDVRIRLTFKDKKEGGILKKIHYGLLTIHSGKQDKRIDLGQVHGGQRLLPAPADASFCDVKIASLEPSIVQ